MYLFEPSCFPDVHVMDIAIVMPGSCTARMSRSDVLICGLIVSFEHPRLNRLLSSKLSQMMLILLKWSF